MKAEIFQRNYRARVAVVACRIHRSFETITELRDALLAREAKRNAHLTEAEARKFKYEYLRQNAPDLITT